jgi:indole-3-glycerol phosphate synthase
VDQFPFPRASHAQAAATVARALTLGDRSAAMLAALSQHLGMPQLVELLAAPARAKALHIAYVPLK